MLVSILHGFTHMNTHTLSHVYMYHIPFLGSLKKIRYHFIIIFRTLSLEKFNLTESSLRYLEAELF